MADWVHCNKCFSQPGSGGRKFSLTNCGHIFCGECCVAATQQGCVMCKNKRCTVILLSAKMKPEVEKYFTEPSDLAKKFHQQLMSVIEFQKNHRHRLTVYHKEKMTKLAKEASALQISAEKQISVLKNDVKYLKKLLSLKGSPSPGKPGGGTISPNSMMRHKGGPSPKNMSPSNQNHQRLQSGYSSDGNWNMESSGSETAMSSRITLRTPPFRQGSGPLSHNNPGSAMLVSPADGRQMPVPPTAMPITPKTPNYEQFRAEMQKSDHKSSWDGASHNIGLAGMQFSVPGRR